MFSNKFKTLTALFILFISASSVLSQQTSSKEGANGTDDKSVAERGFKNRVFEIKYRNPERLMGALGPLTSGHKGASMSYSEEFKTIAVRDFPENIATIEAAIKRLDTPEAPRSDIELRVHVLLASNTEQSGNPYPSELGDVIKQLQSTLNYKNYNLLTSIVQRVKDVSGNVSSSGAIQSQLQAGEANRDNVFYSLKVQKVSLVPASSGGSTVQVGFLRFNLRFPIYTGTTQTSSGSSSTEAKGFPVLQYQDSDIETAVSVRDGEKVVVGTASLRDKGLILVLSAKVLK